MPKSLTQISWRWLLVGALVALVAVAVACGDDDDDDGDASPTVAETGAPTDVVAAPCEDGPGVTGLLDDLKIGVLVPFTGALATFGPEYENAARLAAKCINDAGGVNGGAVEIVTGDTATAAEQGVSEATRLVDVESVVGIVGAASSAVTLAVAESVTGPGQVLHISPASTSPALSAAADDDFLFRTPISDAAQGVLLAQLIADDLGYTSVCAMYVNNAYGQGLLDSFTLAYEDGGGTVTASVAHDDAQSVSYAAQLQQCTADSPEALVAISYPVGQATVYLREALEGSVIGEFVFVDGTRDDEMFAELGWENFDGMQGTAPGALTTDFGDDFDALYEAEFGELYQTPFVREAYDATVAIVLAAAAAGTNTDSVAIRDSLRDVANPPGDVYGPGADDVGDAVVAAAAGTDIDYQGASGSVDFDANGDITFGAIEIWQVDAANEAIVVIQRFSVDLTTGEVLELD
ncbi:MAG: ABC transporter substrate-binding protein [Chloroflexi bacterium]|nr:ABC transporter substrate-binding protein [Chloroflexota bacterium]MCI0782858.1 ABC transporter substrate-binding protein [Chloroflexota bacterium]MCI0842637.1 ABC transporter substrate-binding protein [Chloroflexota bacterium]